MKTFDINEASEFLKVDRTTALDLAGTGELPGAKIGRAWVFMESDLVEYLRDKVRRQTNQRREERHVREMASGSSAAAPATPKLRRRREIPRLTRSAEDDGAGGARAPS